MNMKSKKGTKDKVNKNYNLSQKTIDNVIYKQYNKVESNSKKKGEILCQFLEKIYISRVRI